MRMNEAIARPNGRMAWRDLRDVWLRYGLDPQTIAPEHVAELAERLAAKAKADEALDCYMIGMRALAGRNREIGR